MSKTDSKIKYVSFRENSGGAFDMTGIPRVGTYGCIFCVGVYFRIDNRRAFCAHINGCGSVHDFTGIITEAQGKRLKQTTPIKLQRRHSWRPAEIDSVSVVIVRSQPDHGTNVVAGPVSRASTDTKKLGWYVAEAVKEFLGLRKNFELKTEFQGFVVNHRDDEEIDVPFSADADKVFSMKKPEVLHGYMEHESEGEDGMGSCRVVAEGEYRL